MTDVLMVSAVVLVLVAFAALRLRSSTRPPIPISAVEQASVWLAVHLRDGPRTARDLRAELRADTSADFSWRTVHRAKDRMGVSVAQIGRATRWSLP